MAGFLLGSLILIVADAVVGTRNGPAQANAAAKWGLSGLGRLFSADVAGIPQVKTAMGKAVNRNPAPQTTEPPAPPAAGGPGIAIPALAVPGRGQITF